jgi:hypothetical protein
MDCALSGTLVINRLLVRHLLAWQAHSGCVPVAQGGGFALFSLWGWFAALLSPMNLMF